MSFAKQALPGLLLPASALLLAAVSCGGSALEPAPVTVTTIPTVVAAACDSNAETSSVYVVGLPNLQRTELELALDAKDLTVVSFSCNKLTLLKRCKASGNYTFRGARPKQSVLYLETAEQIRAALPLGADELVNGFQSKAASKHKLDLGLAIVGEQLSPSSSFTQTELQGECAGATHVVVGATRGAFALATSEANTPRTVEQIFKAGISNAAPQAGGTLSGCNSAADGSIRPPQDCQAVLGLELAKIGAGLGKLEVDATFGVLYDDDACEDPRDCVARCDKNEGKACRMLGISEILGKDMDVSIPQGLRHLLRSCDLGDSRGCSALSGMLFFADRYAEAIPFAEKACAISNDPDGCFNLGLMTETSDPALAKKAYKRACDAEVKLACKKVQEMD